MASYSDCQVLGKTLHSILCLTWIQTGLRSWSRRVRTDLYASSRSTCAPYRDRRLILQPYLECFEVNARSSFMRPVSLLIFLASPWERSSDELGFRLERETTSQMIWSFQS